ncbi:MAG TPA: hypothetical protein VGX96_19315, partial [Candidatus Elarobacter sp.]|nr:hypothetical protein [Candidatus Elarobacter sp.]
MDVPRTRALRRIVVGLGVLLFALPLALATPARAASSSLDVGDQAVVNLIVRGRGNELTVRVWDRPTVQVDYSEETVPNVDRMSIPFGTARFPLSQQVPAQLFTLRDRDGAVTGGALAPEEFPYSSFRPGPHDTVRVDAPEGSRLVVTIPANLGILAVRVGGGLTTIEGYRGANLFLVQNQGRVQLTGATTAAFVQVNYGVFYASDGTFDRIRVRGIAAHDVFERCRSKQIEATSINGSLLYDGGSFDPGLARFETQNGHIALGVTSPAQLAAHSEEGHVYTQFDKRANVDQRSDGTATAMLGNGGALINAITGRG